jgi:PKD repeat protein
MVLAACLLIAGAQALMVPQDEASLAKGAHGVVLGTVDSVESRYTAEGEIETTVGIVLESTLKGTFPGRAVTVRTKGGAVDGVMQVVEDEPVLAPGDRGFFLLERGPAGLRVHGARQGVIPVVADRVWTVDGRGRSTAVSARAYGARLAALAAGEDAPSLENGSAAASGGPTITSVSPTSAPAGTGATITITGTGFGTKAARTSAADVGFIYRCTSSSTFVPVFATGKPYYGDNANGVVSWSDTRVVVRVPAGKMSDGYDGSASSGRVWVVTDAGASSPPVPFAVTFGYGGVRWSKAPTFVVNNNCPGVPSAATAVANAASTWNAAVAGSSFRFVNGGTTTSTAIGADGVNRVCWRPASDFSSSGTLAVTTWWYTVATSTITECDVKFNSGFAWTDGTASGSQHSVEAVMLHEFGHWLSLRDLYGYYGGAPSDVGKVMFGYNSGGFGNLNLKTLQADDLSGIRSIYGGGTATSTPTPRPTATPAPVPQAPYPAAHVLPAQVEAEHFDTGGEGVAYHDLEPENLGNSNLRPGEGVDVETNGGVTDVCYVRAGEHLEYSVETTAGESFELALRAANPDAGTKAVRVYLDGVRSADVAIAPTGGWTQYGSFVAPLSVPSGRHVLTLAFEGVERINLDWLRLARPATTLPTTPAVAAVPGGAGVPTDTDGDGLYDDVNGNGRRDFADVVLYFNQMTWIAANEPVRAFDCNENGRIDFADVVALFNAL